MKIYNDGTGEGRQTLRHSWINIDASLELPHYSLILGLLLSLQSEKHRAILCTLKALLGEMSIYSPASFAKFINRYRLFTYGITIEIPHFHQPIKVIELQLSFSRISRTMLQLSIIFPYQPVNLCAPRSQI